MAWMGKPRKRRTELPPEHVAVCMENFAPAFEPLSARAMYVLRSTTALANERIADWLVDFGLTPRTVNVLLSLYCENEGRGVPVSEVGAFIHTAGARLTETIDGLERTGLLRRKINVADRRSTIVRLTVSGKRLIERAYPVLGTNFQRAFQTLTLPERETFIRLLVKLNAGFAALTDAP
jgi:DNA-binding MarR family transcriptional regulator